MIDVKYPHCDSQVLHRPGTCQWCDKPEFQALHEARQASNTSYTGERSVSKKPCPSEVRRPLSVINKWPGNRPVR